MNIEQHAEAAANEIDRSMTDGPVTIIAKHMQSAIDEATARLLARIAELEGLGPLIRQFGHINARQDFDHASKLATHIDAILKGGAS